MAWVFRAIGNRDKNAVTGGRRITVPQGANGGYIQALTQNIRVSFDDNAPATASDGMQIKAGNDVRWMWLAAGSSFSVNEEVATAGFYWQAGLMAWVEWP